MIRTILESKTKSAIISPEMPFTIIGERINPTGRKALAREMAAGDFSRVEKDALAQVAAGAHILDVNAGIPMIDEPAVLAEVIKIVMSVTDTPICIDSSVIEALESGLNAYEGKALVNSVTGEDDVLEQVLPIVKKHNAAVIAISNDETGISEDLDERFAVAVKIVERAMDYGIPREDVVIDPLAMPIGAVAYAGKTLFRLVGRLQTELKVNTVCGASNVSFGLPNREALNAHFLSMAIANGLTSAITNPINKDIKTAILAANVFMAHDENCLNWIQANQSKADLEGRRGGRRSRRRRG